MMLPPGREAKTGTGRLRGRVVAADTGTIVRRAQVRISSPDIGSKTAFTDAQGRYEFHESAGGPIQRERVEVGLRDDAVRPDPAVRAGTPDRARGRAGHGEGGRRAAARQRRLGTHPRRVRRTGRRRQRRRPCACEYSSGKRRLVPSGRTSTTNDLGQFRLFGLPPGEYYVSATVRSFENMMMDMIGGAGAGGPTGSNNNSGYAATYYPGTPNPAKHSGYR